MTEYLSLKSAAINKMSPLSTGKIHYRVLTDSKHQHLYFILTGNDDGGHFSQEVVPFERVEQCLEGIEPNCPIFSKLFAKAFVSRSTNNAGFLAAILRAEQLIIPQVDAVRKHVVAPGWDTWQKTMLAEQGEPYALPNVPVEVPTEPPKPKKGAKSK